MFKKKGDGKGKGEAQPPEMPAQPQPETLSATAPAPAQEFAAPEPEMQMPSEAGGAPAGGKSNPYKVNPVFDIAIPVVLALATAGGFAFTVKNVPDKVAVYGVSDEERLYEIKDKTLVVPTLLAEIGAMPPHTLLAKGENAQALAAAKALVAKGPENVRNLICAGQVMVEAGNKAEKEQGLKHLAKAYELAKYSEYVQLAYARALDALNQDEECIKVYETIVRHFPKAGVVPKRELAELYMKANRSADAVLTLSELMKESPLDPSVQRQLGLALGQDGKQQEGFEEFQKGFTKEQDNLGCPYAVKGIVDAHAGLIESALSDTEKKVAKNPGDVAGRITLARLYIGANKLKEARDTLEAARKIQENNPELHEVMAEVMCRQNQQNSAFDEFRLAASQLHLR